MNLREHVVLGGAAATVLAPVVGVPDAAAFFVASVVIDVDHYWDYLVRNGFRDWSWRRTFRFHAVLFPQIGRRDFLGFNVFHTVEWLAVVWMLAEGLGSGMLFAVLWGMVFHLGLDLARLATHRATFQRALSVVEYRIRRRRLARRGDDPDRVYDEALAAIGAPIGRDPVEA